MVRLTYPELFYLLIQFAFAKSVPYPARFYYAYT